MDRRLPYSHVNRDLTPKESLTLEAARQVVAALRTERPDDAFTWYLCNQRPEHYHVAMVRPSPRRTPADVVQTRVYHATGKLLTIEQAERIAEAIAASVVPFEDALAQITRLLETDPRKLAEAVTRIRQFAAELSGEARA